MGIHILHLQTELNLACGVTRTISQIIKNSSSEFDHHIIALGGDGLSRFEAFKFSPTVLNLDRFSLIGVLKIYFSLLHYCKKYPIQIIHSHHRYFDSIAWLLKTFLKVKTITSVQSKVYGKKIFSYKADMLIACSNSITEHLINNFKIDERRITIIQNAVDPNDFILTKTKSELINELNIPDDKFIIGYFGRLDFKEKGIDILLKAFLNLTNVNKDVFLLLIGNGADEITIRSLIARNKLNAKVMSSQEDIFNYYQLLDLFVLPSKIEPFGIVILESGLMKQPVISSCTDGIPELIENEKDGLLFESENSDDLQNKILKIYNNKKLADDLAKNLYKKVSENFLASNMVHKYHKEYKRLLGINGI